MKVTGKIAGILAAAAISSMSPVPAFAAPQGGLGGLVGGALPNVGSASMGNATGLLGYCIKNKLMSQTGGAGAQSVLGKLTGKKDVQTDPGYAAGTSGTLQTGKTSLPLDSLGGQVKTKVCDMVLSRAKSFL